MDKPAVSLYLYKEETIIIGSQANTRARSIQAVKETLLGADAISPDAPEIRANERQGCRPHATAEEFLSRRPDDSSGDPASSVEQVTRLRVACTVMLKDERTLVKPFLRYHAALFGAENLYVVDNGSTDQAVLDTLADFEKEGVHVDRSHPTMHDYFHKGVIIGDLVKRLDRETPYDFYVLLDCDEFVVLSQKHSYTCDPEIIYAYLSSMRGEERVLRVSTVLNNIPGRPGMFLKGQYAKTIFPQNVLLLTDHGHHVAETRTGAGYVDCDIAYVHFHYRPYEQVIESARLKLSVEMPAEDLDDPAKLRAFKGRGFHMIGYMLGGADAYYRPFRNCPGAVPFPELLARFKAIGTAAPFADFVLPPEPSDEVGRTEAAHPSLAVVVDEATTTRICGWAVNFALPERPVHLRFSVNNTIVWEGLCDALRPDVLSDGKPTDCAGFDFGVGLPNDEAPRILRIEDISGQQITFMKGNSPMTEVMLASS